MSIFAQIGFIITFAAIAGILAKLLKQPLILAYIVVGLIIGPVGLKLIDSAESLQSMGEIGVAFLLFIVGLELNLSKIKKLGSSIITIGLFQIILTSLTGYFLAKGLQFDTISSIYIAIALTFGSTVIVIKLLSEKKLLDNLFGRVALGVLLIQDVFAIGALVFLENLGHSTGSLLPVIALSVVKIIVLIVIIGILGNYLINFLIKKSSKYPELLFIIALAWCFVGSIISASLGLSIEIGAFLAGVSIASSVYTLEVSAKVKPLRDFFVIIFFVFLGIQFDLAAISNFWPVLAFILFVFISHTAFIILPMSFLGFRRRTSFFAGLSLAQISEFSLIIAAVGLTLGHITPETSSIITFVGIVTIILSTYLIKYSRKIYSFAKEPLRILERDDLKIEQFNKKARTFYDHTILLGARRTGFNILQTLIKLKEKIVVVDFNPELAEDLQQKKKVTVVYGDATDLDILENLNLREAKMLISTIPEFADNLITIKRVKKHNTKIIIYVTALDVDEALELYNAGADYVILPHHISGEHVSFLLDEAKTDYKKIVKRKLSHIKQLEKHYAEHGTRH